MSEYQYYEFLAIDRPLGEKDRQALRALSTRARISATQFVNSYEWGNFKGDPDKLMEQWFDLHVYVANWGTRRLMLRLPKLFVDLPGLDPFLEEIEGVSVREAGDNIIVDIDSEADGMGYEDDEDDEDWDDGSDWAGELKELRANLIAGDLRLFYLLWLTTVQMEDVLEDDTPEPLAGIGLLTDALEAFAYFIRLDRDILQAAAESEAVDAAQPLPLSVQAAIAALPEDRKNAFLVRVFNGDPYVGPELQRLLRPEATASGPPLRTAGALRARAEVFRVGRARAEVEAQIERRKREAEKAEKERRARLDAMAERGEAVWGEIETEIGRRNARGYTRAVDLLCDMKALAAESGVAGDFDERLAAVQERHGQKGRFVELLVAAGL